jgi:hypothetical protein
MASATILSKKIGRLLEIHHSRLEGFHRAAPSLSRGERDTITDRIDISFSDST